MQPGADRMLGGDDVAALFGLEMAGPHAIEPSGAGAPRAPRAAAAAVSRKAKRAPVPAAAPAKAPAANVKSIAAQLAQSAGLDRKQAEGIVANIVTFIADYLAEGRSVALSGLGTLALRETDIRHGRNLATGEVIRVVGTRELVFRPAGAQKARAGVR